MELRNIAVGLHQQVQHSHHAEIPIQNSQSHSKCTPVCNKSYSTYRLQYPLLSDVIHERLNKTSQHPGSPSQSTIRATTTTYKHWRLKSCWPLLWSCAIKSNTVIKQWSQSKILRAIANAPRYVTNHTLHTDFNIPYVWRHPWKNQQISQQTESPSQSTITATATNCKH